jgi:hypothetical protein
LWSAQLAHKVRGTPTGILIGSQPRIRKGFVIALAIPRRRDQLVVAAIGAYCLTEGIQFG